MGTRGELLELARHLKQERLFISSERNHLQTLNEKVFKTVEQLFHLAFIAKQQRINLEGLILSKSDCSPALCCQRANILESVNFIEAHKHLGFNESLYGDFLHQLRLSPKLVAMCLVYAEKINLPTMHHAVNIVISSIYGHCILLEDETRVLHLLRHLMMMQLAKSENPRRLLRRGSCAFGRVYKAFNEGLFAAKLFLTAALHDPIVRLLMEDDLFLDIDPGKAHGRFPPQERLRRFGKEGTPEYSANLQRYRNWTISKLVSLTNFFIAGITSNIFCFPPSLVWLVKQLYHTVSKAGKVDSREVGAMCVDLVFSFFICPAIVNPEPYGIIYDTPISYMARFNLIQVGQILTVLAMSKWEEIEPKLMDLYGRFDKDCMSPLLELMLDDNVDENPPESNSQLEGLTRSAMLISEPDLMNLISLLRNIVNECSEENEADKKVLEGLLATLPNVQTPGTNVSNSPEPTNGSNLTPPHTPSGKRTILSKVGKGRHKVHIANNIEDDHLRTDDEIMCPTFTNEVLVISFNNSIPDCPGMLSEQRVLSMEQQNRHSKVRMKLDNIVNEEESVTSGGETHEKRTRFSLSHDQDSIGTSDNLEAISEAASNHSVASSLELENENENENDNLSDMVSANVSGRGTPNVSGRDTPSSQAEGEEREEEPERPLNLPTNPTKQNQEDIDDKFGKFDIRPLIEGDETVSMVSDTWSTDVLASDSEMIEPQQERLVQDVSIPDNSFLDPQLMSLTLHQHGSLDVADTGSEAWSTDVLVSDSERMQDLDTDDTCSVTRSDDTASVARSDDAARFEIETDLTQDEGVVVNVQEHGGDENITPRASGSRSPIDPPQVKSIYDVNGPIVAEITDCQQSELLENSMERLTFLSIKDNMRPSRIETDVTPDGLDRSPKRRQPSFDKGPNLLQMFDPLVPENQCDIPAERVQLRKPCPSPPSLLLNDSWESGEPCKTNEGSCMQSLGRLSMSLGELPERGIMSVDSGIFVSRGSGEGVCNSNDGSVEALLMMRNENQTMVVKQHIIRPLVKSRANSDATDVLTQNRERKLSDEKRARTDDRDSSSGVRLSSGSLTSSVSSSSSGSAVGDNIPKSDINALQSDSVIPITLNAGAIPKSISFDKTAERGDRDSIDINDQKNKKSFFKSLKLPFKARTRKSSRSHEDIGLPYRNFDKAGGGEVFGDDSPSLPSSYKQHLRRTASEDPKTSGSSTITEVGDDILAKYRKKPLTDLDATLPNAESSPANLANDKEKDSDGATGDDEQLSSDVIAQQELTYAFADAKRKLRLVLSSADVATLPWSEGGGSLSMLTNSERWKMNNENSDLIAFLKMQLAEAINLQDRSLVAQLLEALRCVRLFDREGSKKLFRSLRDDYKSRAPYIAYLVRCRQGLLTTLAHLERVLNRIERDKVVCNKFMISVCVRLFLEKRECAILSFIEEFQKLTVADEKTDLVDQFLKHLYNEMEADPLWQAASEEQTKQAQIAIERSIMSRMYIHAFYPNGDGDVMRDKLIYEHIQKLSKILMPNHKYLKIPKIYHYECPWPAAQAEIITINAYKTPQDKLHCVVRCCNTIMNLLRLANEKSVPAADDFLPVVVYVLVKANPPNLLSSIQYVESFYHKHIHGEDEYWWTQFRSAVEFIKTMEYDE